MTAPHGTYLRYAGRGGQQGCRCQRCQAAKREYMAGRRADGSERDERLRHDIPADRNLRERLARRARRHVAELRRRGMTVEAVAFAAGVDRRTVQDVHRVTPRVATSRRLLAVPMPRLRDGYKKYKKL